MVCLGQLVDVYKWDLNLTSKRGPRKFYCKRFPEKFETGRAHNSVLHASRLTREEVNLQLRRSIYLVSLEMHMMEAIPSCKLFTAYTVRTVGIV